MRYARAALLLATLASGLPAAAAAAPAPAPAPGPAPRYVVEPCCNLCSRASSSAAYNTKFLESFITLSQGRDGWLFRSDDLRTTFGPNEEGYRELRRLAAALKRRGVDLVAVYQPPRAMLHRDKLPRALARSYNYDLARFSYGATLERFRKAGLVVPDLTRLLGDRSGEPFFFRGDHHWTPHGAQRTARVVADAIEKLPSYRRMAKGRFTTERTGILMKKGTLYKAATLICGAGYPEQFVDRFATSSADNADLFGETEVPPITLVGTSNSDSAYNFAGFLSEYVGVDILNASVAGGRHDGALLQYLPSDDFQKSPPKVLIWEFETNHNLSQQPFYRQAIPMVTNGCRSRRPILTNRASLKGPRNEVLFNGGGRVLPLKGKDHLIDLQFSDPSVREMEAVIWYTNGSKETLDLKYSPYVNGRGRFVFELRNEPEWADRTFMSLDLAQPEGVKTRVEVTAQLCARDDGPGRQQAAR